MIKPIYKKGDKNMVQSYRGITIKHTRYKIYAAWIRKKLVKKLERYKVLYGTQFGFKKGKETRGNICVN